MDDQFSAAVTSRIRAADVGVAGQGGPVVQQQVAAGTIAAVCQMEPDLLGQRADAVGVRRCLGEGRRLAGLGGAEPFVAGDCDLIGFRLGQGSAPPHGAGHQASGFSTVELLVAGAWLGCGRPSGGGARLGCG